MLVRRFHVGRLAHCASGNLQSSIFNLQFLVLLLLLALSSSAAEFQPKWILPSQPSRCVFTAQGGAGACVLVSLPSRPGAEVAKNSAIAAFDSDGTLLPHYVVHAGSSRVDLLVGIGLDADARQYAVYYGGKDSKAGKPVETARDILPVRLEVLKPAVNNVPTSWAKMFYLVSNAGPPLQVARRATFGKVELFDDLPAEKKPRGRWIARLTSFVLCPQDGEYRFAVNCRDAGFVLVDGELAAEWPGEHDPGKWQRGPPLSLKAGPHRVEALNMCRPHLAMNVGWTLPGRDAIAPIPQSSWLTSREASDTRFEIMSKPIQPDFSFDIKPAYSFRGGAEVFIPVSFRNTTQCRVNSVLRCRWGFGAGQEVEGDVVKRVFTARAVYKVTLETRDALGFTGTCEKTVDCRPIQPREYAAAFDLVDLPASCFAEDSVSPALRLVGLLPPGGTVDAVWEIRDRAGGSKVSSRTVTLGGEPVRLPLLPGKVEAGSLLSIHWQVKHSGVDIGAGTAKFMAPPFDELPARVVGDGVFGSNGAQLVFIPHRHPGLFTQRPISSRQAFGKLLCVDDFLATPALPNGTGATPFHRTLARIVDGPRNPVVQYAPSPLWELSPEAYGPLLKLLQVPAAVGEGTDVVVLSIGLRDLTELKETAAFERLIAAVTDMVAATMKHPVIWVTPPPYASHPERAREFAAAIRRVADARRIPVADLYTTFRGMREEVRPFARGRDLVLSEAGQTLAAQSIARALLQE